MEVDGDLAEVFVQFGFLDHFVFFYFGACGLGIGRLLAADAVPDIII